MPWILWDIIIVAVLAFAAWRGWRRGLILSIAGIAVFVLSIWLAGVLAGQFANPAADSFSTLIGGRAADAFDDAREEYIYERDDDERINDHDPETQRALAERTLRQLNIHSRDIGRLQSEIMEQVTEHGETVRAAATTVMARAIMRIVLFIFFFIILAIVLHLLVRFINTFFEIPIIKQLNQFGGLGVGILSGLLLIFVLAWLIRYTGVGAGTLGANDSFIMGWIQNITPFRIF
ncbi:MAG: CvpA family protein [Oscillospiraceae bacterium]|nr:CvpA family protein [Oscillospiraceae bacterium]